MSDDELPIQSTKVVDTQYKKSKRGKTFTGCWTCRSRKVKCDLRRPNCERCEKSGLECGGYDIKLRWSKPIKFDSHGVQLAVTPSGNMNDEPLYRRRNIDFVRYKEEYQYYEDMDDELTALHNPPQEKIQEGRTWILRKFGVFRGMDKPLEVSPKKRRRLAGHNKPSRENDLNEIYGTKVDTGTIDFLENDAFLTNFATSNHEWISNELKDDALLSAAALQGFPITSFALSSTSATTTTPLEDDSNDKRDVANDMNFLANKDDALQQAPRLLFHRHSPVDNTQPTENKSVRHKMESVVPFEDEIRLNCSNSDFSMTKMVLEVVPSALPDQKIFNRPGVTNPLLTLPTTGLHVHALTRFLLNYYIKNVADLMTVVALDSNPWKILYFPRALKALGDLAGLGYTSNSRNSLLNALLAVSCFNLRSKFQKNTAESQFFLNLGIEFRKQASSFLKVCLKTTVESERYKDVLTAILSMSSIDVVWGTMADCQHHLTVCEDFIEARLRTRPKISEKAKALHLIFCFLKLIQDSTALDKVREKEITVRSSPSSFSDGNGNDVISAGYSIPSSPDILGEGAPIGFSDKTNGMDFIEHIEDETSKDTPIFKNIISENWCRTNRKNLKSNMPTTDDLYGLPKSLILLFSDCVRLVRHIKYYEMNHISPPSIFTNLSLEFEKRLLAWKSEWNFRRTNSQEFISDTIEGIYHHTMSFYLGLIIYYFTMAKQVHQQFLQSYVKSALTHLKSLSMLMKTKQVKIVPLIWQGFMAGCASTDVETQEEFRNWAAGLAENGMGSYWGARQVMFEVWRRRRNKEADDNWYRVHLDWEMNLMLS